MAMTRFQIFLPDDLRASLQTLADQRRVSLAQIIREALEASLAPK